MLNPRVPFVLMASIAAISTAAILVRLVPDMHPIGIAFWRTAIAAAFLFPALVFNQERRPKRTHLLWTIGAGLCLALHFWAWFASLQLTTVMRSTVLVCLTPVWAGLWAWGLFKKPPSMKFWVGICVALVGVGWMGLNGDMNTDGANLQGDLLAVAGGILSGTYLVIGQAIRPHVDWGQYGALLCASCAAWLLGFAFLSGASLSVIGPHGWWVLGAMALGPQLVGHVGFTWAVRFVPATIVGAVILLEPVGATALGAVVLDEWPSVQETAGALVIVLGVAAATLKRRPSAGPGEE